MSFPHARAISRLLPYLLILCALISTMGAALAAVPAGGNWPAWRGDGSGVSEDANLPVSWSPTTNVRWRRPLLGEGSSSPIIWGERAFLTASTFGGKVRMVICVNVQDGSLLWQHEYIAATVPPTDPKSGYAPATPVADGERVFAFFDSPGLVALDMAGKEVWRLPLGPFSSPYNVTNSPILYKDSVILCCDHNGDSFIMAVDKATGTVRWNTPRKLGCHFATPLLISTQGKTQLIVNANVVTSYDADSGKELWTCAGMTPMVSPSPVFDHGLVYVASGRNGPAMAIDPSGSGNVHETHVRMHVATGGPYVVSPLACPRLMLPGDDGNIRFIDDNGAMVYNLRLRAHFTSSPVCAGSRIYWVAENGDTYIIDIHQLGEKIPLARVLAINSLGEPCVASPALARGQLFIRTANALYCLAGGGAATPPPARVIKETFAQMQARFAEHGAPDGPDIPIRLAVIEDLGVLQDPQAIPFLQKVALEDRHWDVSEAAIKALAQYEQKDAVPALLAMFADGRTYLKVPAAQGLGRLLAIDALPTLLKGMSDADAQLRIACLEAVARITLAPAVDSTTTLPALLAVQHDADGAVRAAAACSLGLLAGKAGLDSAGVVAALRKAMADINPLVAGAAREALKAYGIGVEKR